MEGGVGEREDRIRGPWGGWEGGGGGGGSSPTRC